MTQEHVRLVRLAVEQLGEHFDSVQVLVSNVETAGTSDCFLGKGNFYARLGMAQDFLKRDIAEVNSDSIAKKLNPEEE